VTISFLAYWRIGLPLTLISSLWHMVARLTQSPEVALCPTTRAADRSQCVILFSDGLTHHQGSLPPVPRYLLQVASVTTKGLFMAAASSAIDGKIAPGKRQTRPRTAPLSVRKRTDRLSQYVAHPPLRGKSPVRCMAWVSSAAFAISICQEAVVTGVKMQRRRRSNHYQLPRSCHMLACGMDQSRHAS